MQVVCEHMLNPKVSCTMYLREVFFRFAASWSKKSSMNSEESFYRPVFVGSVKPLSSLICLKAWQKLGIVNSVRSDTSKLAIKICSCVRKVSTNLS